MSNRTVKTLFLGLPLGTLLGWLTLNGWSGSREGEIHAAHEAQQSARNQDSARAEAARAVEAHEAIQARLRRWRAETAQALGRGAEVPPKDPELSLRQMLEQTALACAPVGTKVVVRVERFTEFEVLFDLRQPLDKAQLTALSHCLLRHTATYVQSVRFICERSILAELDRGSIEAVSDWATVGSAEIARLLREPGRAEMAAVPTQATPAGAESEELTGDSKRLAEVNRAFSQAWQVSFAKLTNALQAMTMAAKLSDVTNLADLDWRLQLLDAIPPVLAQARQVLEDPVPEFRRLLGQASFDPLLVRILERGKREQYATQQPYAARVFESAAQHVRQVGGYVREMRQQWGRWTITPSREQIEFESTAVQEVFRRGQAETQRTQAELTEALRAWGAARAEAAQR